MVDKFLSMNKVPIDIAGQDDKLVVVRDLESYIGLQASNFTRQIISYFAEKVISQIRQHSQNALMNLEVLKDEVPESSKKLARESISEIKRTLLKVSDFSNVFDVDQGKFRFNTEEYDMNKIVDSIKSIDTHDLGKELSINQPDIHVSSPQTIITNLPLLQQVIKNLSLTLGQN